jgi:hypothetical protein
LSRRACARRGVRGGRRVVDHRLPQARVPQPRRRHRPRAHWHNNLPPPRRRRRPLVSSEQDLYFQRVSATLALLDPSNNLATRPQHVSLRCSACPRASAPSSC